MFRKVALLESLNSPKNELPTKFLKMGIKTTEKFPGSDL